MTFTTRQITYNHIVEHKQIRIEILRMFYDDYFMHGCQMSHDRSTSNCTIYQYALRQFTLDDVRNFFQGLVTSNVLEKYSMSQLYLQLGYLTAEKFLDIYCNDIKKYRITHEGIKYFEEHYSNSLNCDFCEDNFAYIKHEKERIRQHKI